MPSAHPETEAEQLHRLSFFALNGSGVVEEAREAVAQMADETVRELLQLADLHHVGLRILGPIAEALGGHRRAIDTLGERNRRTVAAIADICRTLEASGCPTMAIKSTDHWPDLGHDFDLFTTGETNRVQQIMREQFEAGTVAQSWGDRLANKWNFSVPNLRPLVEIHIGRLGQTGELRSYGEELIERRQRRSFGDVELWIPCREDQILLATLQRLYRHYFYRVCDYADAMAIFGETDFELLRKIAKRQALWQGVATHLRVVSEYIAHYTGTTPAIPAWVRKSARFGIERLYPHAGYLRLPLFPQGATLWGTQVIKTWHRRNRSGALRLGLMPPPAPATR